MEYFMAIRNVVQEGDEVLRKKCFEVTSFDAKLWQLLDDMKETVRQEEGAGLAAPQVGVLRRAVVVDVDEGFFEFVDPVIVASKGEQRGWEGCLSVRGKRGIVTRPEHVKVEYFDRFGKKKKLTAQKRWTASKSRVFFCIRKAAARRRAALLRRFAAALGRGAAPVKPHGEACHAYRICRFGYPFTHPVPRAARSGVLRCCRCHAAG